MSGVGAVPFGASHGDAVRITSRAGIVLGDGRRVSESTSANRAYLLSGFQIWLEEHGTSFDSVVLEKNCDLDSLNQWLVENGRWLFASGKPYYYFSETINAVSVKRPILRRAMQQAWDLAFMWHSYEPSNATPDSSSSFIDNSCMGVETRSRNFCISVGCHPSHWRNFSILQEGPYHPPRRWLFNWSCTAKDSRAKDEIQIGTAADGKAGTFGLDSSRHHRPWKFAQERVALALLGVYAEKSPKEDSWKAQSSTWRDAGHQTPNSGKF